MKWSNWIIAGTKPRALRFIVAALLCWPYILILLFCALVQVIEQLVQMIGGVAGTIAGLFLSIFDLVSIWWTSNADEWLIGRKE